MTVSSSGISRVSTSLQMYTMLARLQANTLRMFREQEHLSTGQQLLTIADDPIAAEKIERLNQSRAGQDQILANLRHADGHLAAADSALTDLADLLTEAARIASEQASSLQSAEERRSEAAVVDGLIESLRALGNRRFQGAYLFGGRRVDGAPLTSEFGRVTYAGDVGSRQTLVGLFGPAPGGAPGFETLPYDISAAGVFALREELVGGYVNFDVQLSTSTRISELAGATGAGVRLGALQVTQTGPALSFQVDFTGAETIADVIARFNAAATAAGSALTLGISAANGAALQISPAVGSIQVSEIGNGTTAADLGIKKSVGAVPLDGDGVQRRITLTTPLAQLAPGGLTLPDGVVITNGSRTATVTFAGATTVQDVLNLLNTSGTGIRAFIKDDGSGIRLENLVAGTPLVIGENGGTDADKLGIKTIDGSVALSRLNGRRGIHPLGTGDDFQVTDANGVSFAVNLSNAKTVGDVINAINAASALAGSGIVAQTSQGGAGLRLTGPAGPGQITVTGLNLSPVARELGIEGTGSATVLEGQNVAAFTQSGVFSALYRLRDALLADNSSEITEAGSDINALQTRAAGIAGDVGARSKAMRDRLQQTEDAVAATMVLLSELKDADLATAVTKFQQAQTALQATLLSTSRVQNLLLLDFLQ